MSQDLQNFLSSSLFSKMAPLIGAAAAVFVIVMCLMSVVKHHREGVGSVVKHCLGYVVLGVIIATPQIWGPVATWVAGGVQSAANYVGTL